MDEGSIGGWDVKAPPVRPRAKNITDYSFRIYDDEDTETVFRLANAEEQAQSPFGDQLEYVLESASGVSINGMLTLLGEDGEIFNDKDYNSNTTNMQALISYVYRGEAEFESLQPNTGDWIAYSKNRTLEFKNIFFRLKPASETYMKISFAWPIYVNTDNETSAFAYDPEKEYPSWFDDKGQEVKVYANSTPVFWDPKSIRYIKVNSIKCNPGPRFYNSDKQTCEQCPSGTKTSLPMA